MALPKNREAVQKILDELEPQILGQEQGGFTCNCGAVHSLAGIAVEIDPAGDTYPGQETLWRLWSVGIKPHDGSQPWSCSLSFFMNADKLDVMFKRYFGDQEEEGPLYQLEIDRADRVHADLPPAVRIQENDSQIRFSFSWGREQDAARELDKLYKSNPRRMHAGSRSFKHTVSLLVAIQPEVYRGGPDPELPYESTWHLDYEMALKHAAEVANYIFFQNMDSILDWRGKVITNADVVFMKAGVN